MEKETGSLKEALERKKSKNITIRLPADLLGKFKRYCELERTKPSPYIKELLEKQLKNAIVYRTEYRPNRPITIWLPKPESDPEMIYNEHHNLCISPTTLRCDDKYYNGRDKFLDKIVLDKVNNYLDIWRKGTYQSIDKYLYHEGLIIYEYTGNKDSLIYLIKVDLNKQDGYICYLLTLKEALGLAKFSGNEELINDLELIESDENKFNKLFENYIE